MSDFEQFLSSLPEERRDAVAAVRKVINKNLPEGYGEGWQHGMPAWFVPHDVYPAGYHCDPSEPLPFCSIASPKGHVALHAFFLYCDPAAMDAFVQDWEKTCPHWKLDMGKACLRFKKMDRIPFAVIGRAVKRATVRKFIAAYEGVVAKPGGRTRS
ncbi:MAG: DUF1801 domain-containing protein [Planctomycetota bacterium]